MNIKHVGIYVNDIDKMTDFYKSVFDMTLVVEKYEDQGVLFDKLIGKKNTRVLITKLITPYGKRTHMGDMLELIKVIGVDLEKNHMSLIKATHISFGVYDIQKANEVILEKGGSVEIEPYQRENGNWISFCRDLEGNWIELIQNEK